MTTMRPKRVGIIAGVMALGAVAALFFACEAPRPTAPANHDASGTAAIRGTTGDAVVVPPWVGEAIAKYYPELAERKAGPPTEVWFVADGEHHVLQSALAEPGSIPGTSLGVTKSVATLFPGLHSGTIQSITAGGTEGWAKDHIRVVWVTLNDSSSVGTMREMHERSVDSAREAEESRLGSRREPEHPSAQQAEAERREREAKARN